MDADRRAKLERYLRNSSRFLWGLGPGNQKDNYKWLDARGYRSPEGQQYRGSYDHVTDDLLERHGIEAIVRDLVAPTVTERLGDEGIRLLRSCWQAGTTPHKSFLKGCGIDARKAVPFFLEVNTQFDYVERWGELAGPWFEEIEPMLE